MSSHRRTALAALALGIAVALPMPMAFARDAAAPDAPLSAPLDAPSADDAFIIAPAEPPGRRPSGLDQQLAKWIAATDDNGARPFMIVDKLGAHIFVFDAEGEFLGSAPVLVGLARGDDSAPGVGDLKLAQISADQRTTPAGRFVASFGGSDGHGTVLWVDVENAISLHPVMSVNPGEHRQKRIKSSDPRKHRISYGCINVPAKFYHEVVLTALAGGDAIVYVLPDTKAVADVFPVFAITAGLVQKTDPPRQEANEAEALPKALDPLSDPKPTRLVSADDAQAARSIGK